MLSLEQSWRWFGPNDAVPLAFAKQAGATGIVTALHHFNCGDVWTKTEIEKQKDLVSAAGMRWNVVESVPVHEQIKTAGTQRDFYIQNYIESLHALAQADIKVVCYNFMPVLDWTRTDLYYPQPDGSTALLFDFLDYVAFETQVLKRKNHNFTSDQVELAQNQWLNHSEQKQADITKSLLMGLPGTVKDLTIEEFSEQLKTYDAISEQNLRDNFAYFLQKVIPEAQALGIKMTVHPDDPPMPIFGLPRIVSNAHDLQWLVNVIDSPANGICFCSGSLGANAANNLPKMINQFGSKINFFHLRSVQRLPNGSFFEANHLEGNAQMNQLMYEIVKLQQSRKEPIAMRPDHGHQMLHDLDKKNAYAGYSAIGRLRGLAELRGLEMGIQTVLNHQ